MDIFNDMAKSLLDTADAGEAIGQGGSGPVILRPMVFRSRQDALRARDDIEFRKKAQLLENYEKLLEKALT